MQQQEEMPQEEFDRLLAWFHPDRNLAGEKYEVIRRGLTHCRSSDGPPEPTTSIASKA